MRSGPEVLAVVIGKCRNSKRASTTYCNQRQRYKSVPSQQAHCSLLASLAEPERSSNPLVSRPFALSVLQLATIRKPRGRQPVRPGFAAPAFVDRLPSTNDVQVFCLAGLPRLCYSQRGELFSCASRLASIELGRKAGRHRQGNKIATKAVEVMAAQHGELGQLPSTNVAKSTSESPERCVKNS